MPGGIVGGSPAPAPFAASLASVSGSFWRRMSMVPRPTTSSTVAKEVASGVFAGQAPP